MGVGSNREEGRRADQEGEDREQKNELDEMLDEALEQSFPASDPVSIVRSLKPGARRKSADRKQ